MILTQAIDTKSDIFTCVCMCDSAHHTEKSALNLVVFKKENFSFWNSRKGNRIALNGDKKAY